MVRSEIDFDRVSRCDALKLFISATNVETGQAHIFEGAGITEDAVMASACLPHLFPGRRDRWRVFLGWRTMAAIRRFTRSSTPPPPKMCCSSRSIRSPGRACRNPRARSRTASTEITFNAGLLREFRAIAFVKELIAAGRIDAKEYRDIRMHRIDADEALSDLSASSKLNAEWAFLEYLRDPRAFGRRGLADGSFRCGGRGQHTGSAGDACAGHAPKRARNAWPQGSRVPRHPQAAHFRRSLGGRGALVASAGYQQGYCTHILVMQRRLDLAAGAAHFHAVKRVEQHLRDTARGQAEFAQIAAAGAQIRLDGLAKNIPTICARPDVTISPARAVLHVEQFLAVWRFVDFIQELGEAAGRIVEALRQRFVRACQDGARLHDRLFEGIAKARAR